MKKAVENLVLVGCKGPAQEEAEIWVAGSAFPVKDKLVMSARHVICPSGQETFLKEGDTWIKIEHIYPHYFFDVQILVDNQPHPTAKFRAPILGERVVGYGAAFGSDGFLTIGHVTRVEHTEIFTDGVCIGGMSGSAIFAEDGAIVGMTVAGLLDQRMLSGMNMAVDGELLGLLLNAFIEENVHPE